MGRDAKNDRYRFWFAVWLVGFIAIVTWLFGSHSFVRVSAYTASHASVNVFVLETPGDPSPFTIISPRTDPARHAQLLRARLPGDYVGGSIAHASLRERGSTLRLHADIETRSVFHTAPGRTVPNDVREATEREAQESAAEAVRDALASFLSLHPLSDGHYLNLRAVLSIAVFSIGLTVTLIAGPKLRRLNQARQARRRYWHPLPDHVNPEAAYAGYQNRLHEQDRLTKSSNKLTFVSVWCIIIAFVCFMSTTGVMWLGNSSVTYITLRGAVVHIEQDPAVGFRVVSPRTDAHRWSHFGSRLLPPNAAASAECNAWLRGTAPLLNWLLRPEFTEMLVSHPGVQLDPATVTLARDEARDIAIQNHFDRRPAIRRIPIAEDLWIDALNLAATLACLALLALAALFLTRAYRLRRAARRLSQWHCPACAYPLVLTQPECPECGRAHGIDVS